MPTTNVVFNGSSNSTGPVRVAVTAAAGGNGQKVSAPGNTECFTIVNVDTSGGIEYKVGSEWKYLGKGTGATVRGNLAGGVMVRCINDGSTSVRIEVSGFGTPTPEYPSTELLGPKKIVAIGDSLVDYGDRFGLAFADPIALNFAIVKGAALGTPAGNGTLTWNRENSTLQWAAPGDVAGEPVKVTSGVFTLPSGTPGYELKVGCKSFTMAATPSQSEVIASGAVSWVKSIGGFMHIVDALTFHRFQVLRNFGISGISAFEIVGPMMQQAIDSGADIIVDNAGTNDIQLRNRTAEQVAADRVACWDQAGAAGKQIIALLLSPRWGLDASGASPGNFGLERAKYSAAFQARIAATNRLLIVAAASRPWVRIADCYRNTTDATQTDGRVRNGYTKDGLHDSGGLAYERALVIARILNTMYPNDSALVNVGAGSYYEATNNPGGNLMTANQGAFAGTTGTAGTGITMGTGLATGMSAARLTGAAVVATANKVAATDGGQDWQELVVSGAAVNHESIRIVIGNIPSANVAIGDVLEFCTEFQVIGTGCSGVYSEVFLSGMTFQPKAQSIQEVIQGLRDGESGVIATEPCPILTGTSLNSISMRLYVTSLAGASFSIRFRNADLHKVSV